MSAPSDMPSDKRFSAWEQQRGITIFAQVTRGADGELISELEAIGKQVAASGMPFVLSTRIHYARFVFIRGGIDPLGQRVEPGLMYLADFDGTVEGHFAELVSLAANELGRIGAHLRDPIPSNPRDQVVWLRQHIIPDATYYVNAMGRTVAQIRKDAELRKCIEEFLDGIDVSGRSPSYVREMIQDFVRGTPSLQWACKPAASDLRWRLRKVAALIVACLVLVPLLLLTFPLLIVWALALRCREDIDPGDPTLPNGYHVAVLASLEDHALQNQFSALGFVKPGWFRRVNATVILLAGKFITRYLFSHEDLAGVKTIHFARWTFIDGKRRMLFTSNYDGSLENYMGDFIDLVWWGLNGIFSNGVGYPRTRWAFLNGAKDEGAFKRHIRNRQIATQVWYAAYPGLSAMSIVANARIRAGLFGKQSAAETRIWLGRL